MELKNSTSIYLFVKCSDILCIGLSNKAYIASLSFEKHFIALQKFEWKILNNGYEIINDFISDKIMIQNLIRN